MGVYDTVGNNNIQVKIDQLGVHYSVGSDVPYEDGLYLGYEGWFVVHDNKIICEGVKTFDKWGERLNLTQFMNSVNPLNVYINEIKN